MLELNYITLLVHNFLHFILTLPRFYRFVVFVVDVLDSSRYILTYTYYIRQVNVVNGGGYIVTLAVCPSVRSL